MPKSRLVELYAHAVGVIRETRVEFGDGFTVLTGETGAGKTLLLDALGLCLGVTPDAARGVAPDTRAAAVFLDREGREVALTRESASGRLRSAIDGVTTSASALRLRAEELIVIHGQHDSLALRNRALVRSLVDRSGGWTRPSSTDCAPAYATRSNFAPRWVATTRHASTSSR